MLQQRAAGVLGEQLVVGFLRRVLADEAARQRQNVFLALAQRADMQRQHVEAEHQVGAEAALGHLLLQVAVGRGDDAHVQLDLAAPAEALHALLLQHAQQLGLQPQRQFADLVEQQGAAVGQLELAGLGAHRAGEGALLMAEENGFEHLLGDRRAVHRDEGRVRAGGKAMDVARHQLLAGAGLASDEDRRTGQGHALGHGQQAATGLGAGNEAFLGGLGTDLAAQQCAQLGLAERRQQVIDATQFQQSSRLFLVGVFDYRNQADITGALQQCFHLRVKRTGRQTSDHDKCQGKLLEFALAKVRQVFVTGNFAALTAQSRLKKITSRRLRTANDGNLFQRQFIE